MGYLYTHQSIDKLKEREEKQGLCFGIKHPCIRISSFSQAVQPLDYSQGNTQIINVSSYITLFGYVCDSDVNKVLNVSPVDCSLVLKNSSDN